MLLSNEQEFLDYITEYYSDRKCPENKECTFQIHFNLSSEDLEDMLPDIFTRYRIECSNIVRNRYFGPELFGFDSG